ncbi:MAG: hypothetical protein MJ171_05400 [Clostridia bacterium]|nr:hypothetical protein [Clostridia bacterium]
MKKILSVLMVLLMVVSFAACSGKKDTGEKFNWVTCENAAEAYDKTGTELRSFLGDNAVYRYTDYGEAEKLVEAEFTDLNTGLEWRIRDYKGAFGKPLSREQASSETGEAVAFEKDNCGQPTSSVLPGSDVSVETLYRTTADGKYELVMITKNENGFYLWMTVLDTPEMPELPL